MQSKTKNLLIIYLSLALFLLLATAVIAHFRLDLKAERFFHDASADPVWFQKNAPLWQLLYRYGTIPPFIVVLAGIYVLVFHKSKPGLRKYNYASKLFLLALILGPGVIINGILKDHWGRPRPRQIEEFGGRWEFREVWQPGVPGKGKSFPCGHASVGFLFFALFLGLKKHHRKIACFSLFFSIAYGSLIGVARMAQGGHFLSDILWAWGITYFVILILHYHVLNGDRIAHEIHETKPATRSLSAAKKIFLTIIFIVLVVFLLFFFLFSKPAYKEFHYTLPRSADISKVRLDFRIQDGDLVFVPDSLAEVLQIEGTMQGFGFPEFKFQNALTKNISGDTLQLQLDSRLSGFFYEKEIIFTCRFDSASAIFFSGNLKNGDIFVRRNGKTVEINSLKDVLTH